MDRKWCEIKNVFKKVFSIDVADDSALSVDGTNVFANTFRSTIQSGIPPKTYNVFKEFKSIVKSSNRLVQAK